MTKGKERLTVSLSRECARFLRTFRAKTHSPSMSALFEKIVSDLQARIKSEELDEKMKAYYDNLSPSEIEEEHAWGKLGEAALASLKEEEKELEAERAPRRHLGSSGDSR